MRSGKASPPFKVRDFDKINDDLAYAALPFNFTVFPLTTYMNKDINDDCSYNGCRYAIETDAARWDNKEVFKPFTNISEAAKPGTQAYLNLTDAEINAADFGKMNEYTDVARALEYEGVNGTNAFTNETLRDALRLQ